MPPMKVNRNAKVNKTEKRPGKHFTTTLEYAIIV